MDLSVKVREMRVDSNDQLLHFFHYYALQDRVDVSHLSNKQPQCLATSLSIADFLPSTEDYQALRDNFAVHLARIAVKKFSAFKFLEEGVPQHIIHRYSKELSRTSHFVSKTVYNVQQII